MTVRGGTPHRRWRPGAWAALTCLLLVAGCSGTTAGARTGPTPLEAWLRATPVEIAHRGGDADRPEGTAAAYRQAAARNPALALEVPVWRTADGVWVVSEDRTTGRVFDGSYPIPTTTWATLSRLRTRQGQQPMARLEQDVLDVYGDDRVLFVDDKADRDAAAFLDLLDSHAGRSRYVVKCFWQSTAVAAAAHERGYLTWAYYDAAGLPQLTATQDRFDLLGIPWSASAADWTAARATGKPVIAHVVATAQQARTALDQGARGLMVSGVDAVVPQAAAPSRAPG